MSESNTHGFGLFSSPPKLLQFSKSALETEPNSHMYVCNEDIRITGRLLRVARLDADKYHFLSDPKPLIEGLRGYGQRVDLFTFTQSLSDTEPKYSYPMEWDNFAALPISTFEDWWNRQIGFKARNKAKQAEKKGVVVREVPFNEELVRGIWEIYNEAPTRQGRRFPHYGKGLDTVRREASTYLDSSTFIGAYQGEELIGFIKLVADEIRAQAGLMNVISKIRHRDSAPTNALLAQAVRSCADRGISYMVYSNFAYGKKQLDSVSDFKKRNGFRRIDVPRYYVPLTRFGRVALRLGLHHRIVDHFPESLAAKVRQLRSHWYNRKFKAVRETFENPESGTPAITRPGH